MIPYWRDEKRDLTIYHGDCREVLPGFADDEFDSVITDPPYNVGLVYGVQTADDDKRDDYPQWCREWFAECRRVAATVAVSCGRDNLHAWFDLQEPDGLLCWYKPNSMLRSCPFGFAHWEPIVVYGLIGGECVPDVLRTPIVSCKFLNGHPCPKPAAWATEQVKRLRIEPGAICDPFLGSGTTLAACAKLGLRGVGIEIEEEYCEMAAARLSGDVTYGDELTLFKQEATA